MPVGLSQVKSSYLSIVKEAAKQSCLGLYDSVKGMLSLLVFILLLSPELNHGSIDLLLVLDFTLDLVGVIVVHVLIAGLNLCLHEGLSTGESPIPSL